MKRTIMAFVTTLVLLGVACASEDQGKRTSKTRTGQPTVKEMRDRIKSQGAEAVVNDLFPQKDTWRSVLDQISSGKRDWLQVALELRKGSDGGASEELNMAAAEALQKAPAAVLDLLEPGFTIDTLCGNENTLGDTLAESLRVIEDRRKAVRGVTEERLEAKKERCLQLLDELEKEAVKNADTWFPQ